jgi:hypothetical protein
VKISGDDKGFFLKAWFLKIRIDTSFQAVINGFNLGWWSSESEFLGACGWSKNFSTQWPLA